MNKAKKKKKKFVSFDRNLLSPILDNGSRRSSVIQAHELFSRSHIVEYISLLLFLVVNKLLDVCLRIVWIVCLANRLVVTTQSYLLAVPSFRNEKSLSFVLSGKAWSVKTTGVVNM